MTTRKKERKKKTRGKDQPIRKERRYACILYLLTVWCPHCCVVYTALFDGSSRTCGLNVTGHWLGASPVSTENAE